MDARAWMAQGYMDGRSGVHSPPNHPIARGAYEHGQQSARNDEVRVPNAPYAERVAAADAIFAADEADRDISSTGVTDGEKA